MKMHLLNRLVMHERFGLSQAEEYLSGSVFDAFRQTRAIDYFDDVGKMAVRMFMSGLHTSVGCADAGTVDRLKVNCITRNAQQRKLFLENLRIDTRGDHG